MEDCMSFDFQTVDQHSNSCIISKKKTYKREKGKKRPLLSFATGGVLFWSCFFLRDVSSAGFLKSTLAPTSSLKMASGHPGRSQHLWGSECERGQQGLVSQTLVSNLAPERPSKWRFSSVLFSVQTASEGFMPVTSEQGQRHPPPVK